MAWGSAGIYPADGYVNAWVLVGARVVERSYLASRWDSRQTVTGSVGEDALAVAVALSESLTAAEREREADRVWRAALVSDLHEEANRREFCSDFDAWMEEHDLPRRSADYAVTLDVTVRVCVQVDDVTSAESACEAVNSSMVASALRAVSEFDDLDWSTDGAEQV